MRNGLLGGLGNQGRVLGNMFQGPVLNVGQRAETKIGSEEVVLLGNTLERCLVVETKVTSVDDVVGAGGPGKLVQRPKVTCKKEGAGQ